MITWHRYYRAQPGQGDAFARLLRAAVEPALGALTTAGRGSGWGIAVQLTHNDDSWTHLLWVDFADWAAVEGFADTLARTELPASVARDVVLRHTVHPEAPPRVDAKYLVFHMHWIRRGHDDDALALFNEWAKPVFEELAEAGRVGAWAQMAEDTAVTGDWRFLVRYPIAGLAVLDDVAASLTKFEMARLKSFEVRLMEMSERNYRGQILRILHAA